ncbi:MAG: TRAP transporter small permease [Desulfohalobiaceae bacterium]
MFSSLVDFLSSLLQKLAGVILVLMMLVTCADVAGNLMGKPLLGAEEIVSLLAALVLAFVLPKAHVNRAHIGIDLVYRKLSARLQKWNDIFVGLASLFFFLLASWQCFEYAIDLQESGEVSATLELPFYYILYAISFSTLILALAILQDLVQAWRRNRHE